jgi:uncharacterized protein (UPF0332 family)
LIFEERTIAPKTHDGTHALFHEIAVHTGRVSRDLAGALALGLRVKNNVDYEPIPEFSDEDYARYVDRAAEFVAAVKKLIEKSGPA